MPNAGTTPPTPPTPEEQIQLLQKELGTEREQGGKLQNEIDRLTTSLERNRNERERLSGIVEELQARPAPKADVLGYVWAGLAGIVIGVIILYFGWAANAVDTAKTNTKVAMGRVEVVSDSLGTLVEDAQRETADLRLQLDAKTKELEVALAKVAAAATPSEEEGAPPQAGGRKTRFDWSKF